VSDYGRGITAHHALRAALARRCRGQAVVVWDPHPRGSDPPPGTSLVTPNQSELGMRPPGRAPGSLEKRAIALAGHWRARALSVTRGELGALLVRGEQCVSLPTDALRDGDPCGAGDRFAAAAACALGDGEELEAAVRGAVLAASAFVAGGGAAGEARGGPPQPPTEPAPYGDPRDAIESVRRRGGTVVATGGCFDLLHAGHLATLEGARALGDCLVVCINTDASVRRLKGSGRPLVSAVERARLLQALRWVDAVIVFEEDEPLAAIRRLRPDVWVKGGDYRGQTLPESGVLSEWGGRSVVLPYLDGHSTTRLIEEAAVRAAG
jgi:D-beta-D-heptose 7-phosphate kinase / D-beta-D-heptose 1-phosphate adenosyltransferase